MQKTGLAACGWQAGWPRHRGYRRQGDEGADLEYARDNAGCRPYLAEVEQPKLDRYQVAAQGAQREDRCRRCHQSVASKQDERSQSETDDDLKQEKPADSRNAPITGQIQVQVYGRSRD